MADRDRFDDNSRNRGWTQDDFRTTTQSEHSGGHGRSAETQYAPGQRMQGGGQGGYGQGGGGFGSGQGGGQSSQTYGGYSNQGYAGYGGQGFGQGAQSGQ